MPRAPIGLGYHEALGQVVLMGGQDLEQAFSDTWIWNGTKWTKLEVEGPGPRGFQAMTYDAGNERILLYGGRQDDRLFKDLWSWDGNAWHLLADDGPVRRGIYASAFDRSRGSLVIHGSGDRVEGKWDLEAATWTWTETAGWVEAVDEERR